MKKIKKKEKNVSAVKKIAINGFGRIGKQFLLAALESENKWEFIINDLTQVEDLVYSLKYDSVHKQTLEISHDKSHITVNGKRIKVISEADALKLPWKSEKIDLVVDCSGRFTERENAIKHIQAGAKKVLISAPAKNHDRTIVYGINNEALKDGDKIISAGSCTTNCVAPMVKIINDAYKIKSAQFITTHAYTSTQKLVDAFDSKDQRRGRAAAQNIIPSTSGASISVIEVLPELKGLLEGYALRVPVIDGSITSLVCVVEYKPNDSKQVNLLLKKKALEKKEILEFSEDNIVSQDIVGNGKSCIIDSALTYVNGNMISIAGWYDNEYGYSHRLSDVAKLILEKS